jgi:hypothetical protein
MGDSPLFLMTSPDHFDVVYQINLGCGPMYGAPFPQAVKWRPRLPLNCTKQSN